MLLKVTVPATADGIACALVAAASQADVNLQFVKEGSAVALEVDGRVLRDAVAICRHFALASGSSHLLPSKLPQSAVHDSLLELVRTSSQSALPLEQLEKTLKASLGPFLLGIRNTILKPNICYCVATFLPGMHFLSSGSKPTCADLVWYSRILSQKVQQPFLGKWKQQLASQAIVKAVLEAIGVSSSLHLKLFLFY